MSGHVVILLALAVMDIALPSVSTVFAGNPANNTLDAFMEIDVRYFQIETSVADTIILCAFRGLLIVFCTCCDQPLRTVARVVAILSQVYLLVKVSVCYNWDFAYTYIIYITMLLSGVVQAILLDRPLNICCKRNTCKKPSTDSHGSSSNGKKVSSTDDIEVGKNTPLLDPLAGGDGGDGGGGGGGSKEGVGGGDDNDDASSSRSSSNCLLYTSPSPRDRG